MPFSIPQTTHHFGRCPLSGAQSERHWLKSPTKSLQVPHIPVFNVLQENRFPRNFTEKHEFMEMRRCPIAVIPGQTYSVSQAARYLGVHRCTIYTYIKHPENPLPFTEHPGNGRLLFYGNDLMAYKAVGPHKKGRKRKDRFR